MTCGTANIIRMRNCTNSSTSQVLSWTDCGGEDGDTDMQECATTPCPCVYIAQYINSLFVLEWEFPIQTGAPGVHGMIVPCHVVGPCRAGGDPALMGRLGCPQPLTPTAAHTQTQRSRPAMWQHARVLELHMASKEKKTLLC